MELTEVLSAISAMQPIVTRLMQDVERSDVPGSEKKAQVMELSAAVYEGARRTGALGGVKELRGVDWELLAPVVSILIDGLVGLFKAVGVWFSRRRADAEP